MQPEVPSQTYSSTIPQWVKSTVNWWSEGKVSDDEFFNAMGYLIKQNILKVPSAAPSNTSHQIPGWIRSNADLWVSGQITDYEFIRGIQYLVSNGVIKLS